MSRLVVTRPRQDCDMLRQYRLIVDDEFAYSIRRGQSIDIDPPRGRHCLVAAIDWGRSNSITIELSQGQQLRLEVSSNVKGWRLPLAIFYATIWCDRCLYLMQVQ